MRYVVKVNNKEYDVEVEKLGGPYQSLSRSTAYMQGVQVAAPLSPQVPQPAPAQAPVAPAPAAAAAPVQESSQSSNEAEVVSPMPGKVFKVLAKEGDKVSEGQAVIILEAMKMENEIVSPVSGVIDKLLVREGDMVDTDAVLATLK